MRTRVWGRAVRMSRVSMPEPSESRSSMTITSGKDWAATATGCWRPAVQRRRGAARRGAGGVPRWPGGRPPPRPSRRSPRPPPPPAPASGVVAGGPEPAASKRVPAKGWPMSGVVASVPGEQGEEGAGQDGAVTSKSGPAEVLTSTHGGTSCCWVGQSWRTRLAKRRAAASWVRAAAATAVMAAVSWPASSVPAMAARTASTSWR
jgi:hypothetical protein